MELEKRIVIRRKNDYDTELSIQDIHLLKDRFISELKASIENEFNFGIGWFLGFGSSLYMIGYEIIDVVEERAFEITDFILVKEC